MKFLIIVLSVVFLVSNGFAADIKQNLKLVNQVLFEINDEAYTTYDFKNYLKNKQDLKIQSLLPLVENELEEFILFNLCQLEVQNLDFQLSTDQNNKLLTSGQRQFLLTQNFLKLKEKHIGQISRYKSWTDILKRKYNYLAKIDELK